MRKLGAAAAAIVAASLVGGCVNVKAPDEVRIGGHDRPPPVDTGRMPRTSSHDECRAELQKAYQNIQYLEGELSHWRDKAEEYKRERDRCEDRLDECEDRLEQLRERD